MSEPVHLTGDIYYEPSWAAVNFIAIGLLIAVALSPAFGIMFGLFGAFSYGVSVDR